MTTNVWTSGAFDMDRSPGGPPVNGWPLRGRSQTRGPCRHRHREPAGAGARRRGLAERKDGWFEQRAAVKRLHASLMNDAGAERFRREASILARRQSRTANPRRVRGSGPCVWGARVNHGALSNRGRPYPSDRQAFPAPTRPGRTRGPTRATTPCLLRMNGACRPRSH